MKAWYAKNISNNRYRKSFVVGDFILNLVKETENDVRQLCDKLL